MLTGLVGRIPYALYALDAPALHFQDQAALRMKQHEVGLNVRARSLTHDVQRVKEYIVIR